MILGLLGDSYRWLVLVRAFIYLSSHFGLLCLLFALVLGVLRGAAGPFTVFVGVIGVIETAFYLFWFLPYRSHLLKQAPYRPPPLTQDQRKALFQAALDFVPDVEQWIRKWMRNAHADDIRRENLKDWLLWMLFEHDGPAGDYNHELEDFIDQLEQRLEARIKPGRGEAEALRPSFDPLPMRHRSLLYYAVVGLLDSFATLYLLVDGFSIYRLPRRAVLATFPPRPVNLLSPHASASPILGYLYRPHRSRTARPILLVHDVGVGLLPYLPFLRSLPRDIGVLALELLPLTNRVAAPLAPTAQLVDAVAAVLAQHAGSLGGAGGTFVLVAHGAGSLLAAPLLSQPDLGPRVERAVLVDPVALLLHLPDWAYSLLGGWGPGPGQRPPRTPNEWLLWYCGAADPGVASTLGRRVCWREMVLWREALLEEAAGRRTTVVVGGRDRAVNAAAVASYAHFGDTGFAPTDQEEWRGTRDTWTGVLDVELMWLEGVDRGEVLLRPELRALLRKAVRCYTRRDVKTAADSDAGSFVAIRYDPTELGAEVAAAAGPLGK